MDKTALKERISAAHGAKKADIVLKNGQFFDLVTGELISGDIAISGDVIVGTCEAYEGETEIDIAGRIAVPGFIDTHLHIESSMVTPFEFDRCVTPRGITTAICDPHEIANVIGVAGIEYFLEASQDTIMDIFVQLSSCVPSTHMETSGATIDANLLKTLKNHPRSLGLAEFMNYPGVIYQDDAVLDKLLAFEGRHIDGHAPLVRGKDLNAYLAAGIRTDHETTTTAEALEKLQKGMHILVREGSVSKDLDALLPIITERNSPYISLCTDDRNPLDIAEHGHLDYMIRHAIENGAPPLAVYRAASISAAKAFGLFDRGLIAPGKRADIVIVDSLESCRAETVIAGGVIANETAFSQRNFVEPVGRNSVNAPRVSSASFKIQHNTNETDVIGVIEGKIITAHLNEEISNTDDEKRADISRDLAKISVVERHGKNGNISNGFVRGFQMRSGAIAASVCHDHHNLVAVGVSDDAMAVAVNHLREIEGGFVVVNAQNEVAASLPLPIAGLMSMEPFENVHSGLVALRDAARANGIQLEEPFLQLAFLCLPAIPHLKITDFGMVDVDRFEVIS